MFRKQRHALILLLGFCIALSFVVYPGAVRAQSDIQINFSDAATAPPSGYLRDSGEAYANRGNGYSYGWVTPGTNTPLNLSSNGRKRTTPADVRLASFMHMQADDIAGNFNGTKAEGWWEVAVPNGFYSVTVSVGDSDQVDSIHRVYVEGAMAISDFIPSGAAGSASRFTSGTLTIQVNDGRLTVGGSYGTASGVNTKINYITISPSSGPARPTVVDTVPANLSTGVGVTASISVTGIYLPNGGLDNNTVTNDTVYLYRTAGSEVSDRVALSSLNTTGGGDAITLTPANPLLPNTNYTLVITSGVRDGANQQMLPYRMSFTTGAGGGNPATVYSFSSAVLNLPARSYMSAVVGPDGDLYASTRNGFIYHWDINPSTGLLSNEKQVANLGNRIIVGMAFQPGSNATNAVLWVSHNQGVLSGATHFSGSIARITGTNIGAGNESWTAVDMVTGLPRARKDHLSNSLAFGPDGALYMPQGSISATGAPDNQWGQQPESLLSAALLRMDINLLNQYVNVNGTSLNVRTGTPSSNNLAAPNSATNPGLGDPLLDFTWPNIGAPAPAYTYYDPTVANAPLTIYATGIRNAYDLLWHTNGRLYSATNGSAQNGSVPGTPAGANIGSGNNWPVSCSNRLDGRVYWSGTSWPAGTASIAVNSSTNNLVNQSDYLFNIVPGGYYGHPNPTRCEWVKDGGNPTANPDPWQVGNHYTIGTLPDPNYRGVAYDVGFNKSPNGTIEYRNTTAFGGALAGSILIVRYSQNDDILVIRPSADGSLNPANVTTGVRSFDGFNNPLDLTENISTGDIYLIEYGDEATDTDNRIFLLRPDPFTPGTPVVQASTSRLVLDDIAGGAASTERFITLTNVGTGSAGVSLTPQITGPDAAMFQVTTAPTRTLLDPAGQPNNTMQFGIRFNPPSGSLGPKFAAITFLTTDPAAPQITVQLSGLSVAGTFGTNEPSLQYILNTYAITTNVGDDDPTTAALHSTLANNAPLLGQEISAQNFRAAAAGPVMVYPLAVYGPNSASFSATVSVGWIPIASPNNKNPLFTVPSASSQTLNPSYSGSPSFSFTPAGPFSFYSIWPAFSDREVFQEDVLNTWADTMKHKARIYPFVTGGSTVPNAYIVAFEETPTGQDYNDVVFLVTNIAPAQPGPGGSIIVENRDWAGLNTLSPTIPQLAYVNTIVATSRINSGLSGHRSHDTVTLRIYNVDAANPLYITGITISSPNDFEVLGTTVLTIPPSSTYDMQVRMKTNSGSAGARNATMTLATSDPNNPNYVMYLNGSYLPTPSEGNEPSITQILGTFGFTTDLSLPLSGQYVAHGDEVLGFRWRRANGSQPVYVRQLAAFHDCCSNGTTFTLSGAGGGSMTHDASDGVSMLPLRSGQNNPAELVLNPTANTFTIDVGGFSTDECESALDGAGICNAHGLRLFKLRDYLGALVPNSYVLIQDSLTGNCGPNSNCDWNDNVYIITNIEPVLSGPAAVTLQAPAAGATLTNGYGDPTFTWSNVDNATYYYFYLTKTDGQQVANEVLSRAAYCTGAVCEFTPADLREQYRLYPGTYNWQVTSWGPFGAGASSPVRTFTMQPGLPALATLTSATNTTALRPTMNWALNTTEQRRAVGFNLYLAKTTNLAEGAFFQYVSRIDACGGANGTTCSFVSPVDLIDGTLYSLYIQSYGPGGFTTGGPFSNGYAGPTAGVSSFTVDAPTPDLPTPISVNFNQGLPSISWPDDTDSTSFNVAIATQGWASFPFVQSYPRTTGANGICNGTSCTIRPLLVLNNGTYNFAVQGVSQGGTSQGGTYNNGYGVLENRVLNIAAPVAPSSGLSPADLDNNPIPTVATGKPTFTWNTVAGATAYQLWVGRADLTPLHVQWYWAFTPDCQNHPGQCSISPNLNLPVGQYVWNVQSFGPGGLSNWGTGWFFNVTGNVPGLVSLTSPDEATIGTPSPQFTWQDISSAEWYQFWLGDANLTPLHVQWYRDFEICTSGTCTLSVPNLVLPNGQYYWNVQAASPAGIGPWQPANGDYGDFVVAVPVPGVPTLVSPINDGLVSNTNRPTLQWNTVTNGVAYQLEVRNGLDQVVFSQSYTRGVAPCTEVTCTAQVSVVLPYGGYTWRVQAASQGGVGNWSLPRNFMMLSVNTVPMMVDTTSGLMARSGEWTQTSGDVLAYGDDYLTSGISGADTLTVTFEGTSVDVIYVAGPQYGSFIVEIDGAGVLGVNASATQTAYGQLASVTDLAPGTHTLRIIPLAGMRVAIDAIVVGGQAVTPVAPPVTTPVAPTPTPIVVTPEPTPVVVTPEPTPVNVEPTPVVPEATAPAQP
ncbi:MAG: Ig-like domain-containing protein [bacterium]|nr:Ig-like domain-containing protein [bacterium]